MCPACLVSAALIAGSATAGGGTVAVIVRKILHHRLGRPSRRPGRSFR
jgi:hypothetical protein